MSNILHSDDVLATHSLAADSFALLAAAIKDHRLRLPDEVLDYSYSSELESNRRAKMLDHLKEITESLKSQGFNPTYYECEEKAILSWFDSVNNRNSISIWPNDCEGVWSCIKGETIIREDFDTLEEFLGFTGV